MSEYDDYMRAKMNESPGVQIGPNSFVSIGPAVKYDCNRPEWIISREAFDSTVSYGIPEATRHEDLISKIEYVQRHDKALRAALAAAEEERDAMSEMLTRIAGTVADYFHAPNEENVADGVDGMTDALAAAEARVAKLREAVTFARPFVAHVHDPCGACGLVMQDTLDVIDQALAGQEEKP